MTRLILVRHGETQWNSERRYIGVTDQELNEKGKSQAQRLAAALKGVNPLVIYCSALKRAKGTAEIISQACNTKLKTVVGLNEIDFGSWEGLTFDEIQARHPHLINDWQELQADFQMPGGEKWQEFRQRVKRSFDKILAENSGEMIAVVTHAGPIKYILCYLLKMGPLNFWKFQIDHGSITILELDKDRIVIALLNGTHHLSSLHTNI